MHRLRGQVLPAQGLQLGHDERWSHEPVVHGRGHAIDLVPVLDDRLVQDAAAKHWGESAVVDTGLACKSSGLAGQSVPQDLP